MTFKEAVIATRNVDILKALQGVIHHNNAVKDEYKLPASLIRQVEQAIELTVPKLSKKSQRAAAEKMWDAEHGV